MAKVRMIPIAPKLAETLKMSNCIRFYVYTVSIGYNPASSLYGINNHSTLGHVPIS